MERLKLNITGTQEELWGQLDEICPDIRARIVEVRSLLKAPVNKRDTRDYEAALLYILSAQYDYFGAKIAEVGTGLGFTAAIMQHAAPRAHVMTCTPDNSHVSIARGNLKPNFQGITVLEMKSVEWLEKIEDGFLDMVYIDGDHKHVRLDLPFYNKLKVGGLKFHHDYWLHNHFVYVALLDFAEKMHPFDVLMTNEKQEAVGGWYRQEGEVWIG
jgi:predicted O-methyltransferase YrrM